MGDPKDLSEMAPKARAWKISGRPPTSMIAAAASPPGVPGLYQYELRGWDDLSFVRVGADKVPGTSMMSVPVLTEEEMRSTGYRKAPSP
jgi:hypothetical protein